MRNAIAQRQERQRYYYDRLSKALPPLNVGDNVGIQSNKTWVPAKVTKTTTAPRSYLVTTPEGQTYRRNRNLIRRSQVDHDTDPVDISYRTDTHDSTQPSEQQSSAPEQRTNNMTTGQDTLSPPSVSSGSPKVTPLQRSTRSTRKPESYVELHASQF